jgi:hypothetical protein
MQSYGDFLLHPKIIANSFPTYSDNSPARRQFAQTPSKSVASPVIVLTKCLTHCVLIVSKYDVFHKVALKCKSVQGLYGRTNVYYGCKN